MEVVRVWILAPWHHFLFREFAIDLELEPLSLDRIGRFLDAEYDSIMMNARYQLALLLSIRCFQALVINTWIHVFNILV
jgi:hypothetical protein